jgi:predicted branched-subunit amino acid permease
MLADTRWMGNGAGGFGALLPIYQDIDRSVAGPYAPTTVATVVIELGRPALYALVLIAVILLIQLLRGALQRGRDSFYPTVGAGCVVLLTFEAFCDPALLEKPTNIIAGAIIGLALAQSVSRTSQTV